MQNDLQAENAILEAIRILSTMGVQLNEITVPMKAVDILNKNGLNENALERVQSHINLMLQRDRVDIDKD
jgi:hypothetical protein